MSRRGAAFILIVVALGSIGPGGVGIARGQAADRAIEFEDLGFTRPGEPGVRSSALRAFAASATDATALVLNTAGLARVKRVHGGVAFAYDGSRVEVDYGNGATGDDLGALRLAFAGVAFPIPVLRGSLVPAVSVHRAFTSDLAIDYARDNAADGRSETFAMEQRGATYAYSLGVGTDLSSALSAGVSVFGLDGSIDTQRQYDWQPLVTDPAEHTFVLEDIASDVSGYGAQIGMQLFLHERASVGIRFNTPTIVNIRSAGVREETRQVDNDVGSFVREETDVSTEYILPYRVDGAIAVPVRSLLMTAQVSYMNWGEAAIDGRRILTQETDPVLDAVVGFGGGVEWSPARLPLRLRAGFEHAPAPLRYLQTDRIDNDRLDRVQAESGRTRIAAGAGLLLRSRIVVDAAWVHTSGSRESNILRDQYRASLVSVQGTYWF